MDYTSLHAPDDDLRETAHRWATWAVDRAFDGPTDIGAAPNTLHTPAAITPTGLGTDAAWRLWEEHIAPANIALDHQRFFAFLPIAPAPIATAFDMVVSAAALGAESWMEAAGAVHAENEALRWLADEFGMPQTAVGCFVSGGSAGNLSALAVARDRFQQRTGSTHPRALLSEGTHASVGNALRLLGVEAVKIPGQQLIASTITTDLLKDACAIIATAGTTNAGIIDDLSGLANLADEHDIWLHVDGAYGGAAALAPSTASLFHGIGRADSIIVDPHKWLFAPLDSCALLYKQPDDALRTHRQHAAYLDPLQGDNPINPSDLAFHLTRRARGLPLWMILAVHGTDALRAAIEQAIIITKQAAQLVKEADHLELVIEPQLSILLVRRIGWDTADYNRWSQQLLANKTAFVVPTTWEGETVARFGLLHPLTPLGAYTEIFDTMKHRPANPT
jgi:glutamate/tyrosine decarboxylase-like PLP-dependent enzyme